MTKRDLIKWLEKKAAEATKLANEQKTKSIKDAEEVVYAQVKLDEFVNEVNVLYQELLKKYDDYFNTFDDVEGVSISKFYYKHGYNDLIQRYAIKQVFKQSMIDAIKICTPEYNKTVAESSERTRKVISTYDTVIMTVKNLPTAKDGLEYLKKLGFDISEIQPAEHKKQLPATIKVNVDTDYLLLREDK